MNSDRGRHSLTRDLTAWDLDPTGVRPADGAKHDIQRSESAIKKNMQGLDLFVTNKEKNGAVCLITSHVHRMLLTTYW